MPLKMATVSTPTGTRRCCFRNGHRVGRGGWSVGAGVRRYVAVATQERTGLSACRRHHRLYGAQTGTGGTRLTKGRSAESAFGYGVGRFG